MTNFPKCDHCGSATDPPLLRYQGSDGHTYYFHHLCPGQWLMSHQGIWLRFYPGEHHFQHEIDLMVALAFSLKETPTATRLQIEDEEPGPPRLMIDG